MSRTSLLHIAERKWISDVSLRGRGLGVRSHGFNENWGKSRATILHCNFVYPCNRAFSVSLTKRLIDRPFWGILSRWLKVWAAILVRFRHGSFKEPAWRSVSVWKLGAFVRASAREALWEEIMGRPPLLQCGCCCLETWIQFPCALCTRQGDCCYAGSRALSGFRCCRVAIVNTAAVHYCYIIVPSTNASLHTSAKHLAAFRLCVGRFQ